jgi:hypothetical protein
MAKGDRKHFGRGARGKKTGTGAMTEMPVDALGDNEVLSNRDKAQHPRERGQDSKWLETEQHRDHAGNRGRD